MTIVFYTSIVLVCLDTSLRMVRSEVKCLIVEDERV